MLSTLFYIFNYCSINSIRPNFVTIIITYYRAWSQNRSVIFLKVQPLILRIFLLEYTTVYIIIKSLSFSRVRWKLFTWDRWTAEIQSRPSRSLTDVIHQYSDHFKNGSSARLVAWSNKAVSDFFLGTTLTSLKNPSIVHNGWLYGSYPQFP